MKIGIDHISTIGGGGNARYSSNLIRAVSNIDNNNKYYLFGFYHDFLPGRSGRKSGYKNNFKKKPGYFSSFGLPIPNNIISIANRLSIKLFTKLYGIRIFHFTNPLSFIPNISGTVITIHDLAALYGHQWTKKNSKEFLESSLKNILHKVDHIIAVSFYTKKDIIKNFDIDERKITVIHEAADKIFYPDIDKSFLKQNFGLDSYLLYVGQLQPRKNITKILLAYSLLSSDLKEKYPLVLVGGSRDKGYYNIINKIIAKNNLSENVKQFGYLDDNSVRKLYSGARAFIFPSLFEGFGLPVLESLQCGTPVITSKTTSLPEVAGDAGLLVNPEDVQEIYRAMEKILLDQDCYVQLKNICINQAQKFSWDKAARETIQVYESLNKK